MVACFVARRGAHGIRAARRNSVRCRPKVGDAFDVLGLGEHVQRGDALHSITIFTQPFEIARWPDGS